MQTGLYSLVLRTAAGRLGMARAQDPQTLRNHGLRHATDCAPDEVFLLVTPQGRTIEWFDTWTNQWCTGV